jgi:very-short-patch-repair endonuclease
LAGSQHGVISRRQLDELGTSRRQIERAVERGDMRSLFRGVYLLGPFEPAHAREMGAVLACSPGSYVSHRAATALCRLLPYPAEPAPVDITVMRGNPGEHPGIRVHRTLRLEHYEIREIDGIPVTSPVRTLIDFAGTDCTDYELESAVAEAFALRLTNRAALLKAVRAAGRRRGVRGLRTLLDGGPKRTRSTPERRLLSLIRKARLPEPETNFKIGRWEVDFYWPAVGLVVEVDAYSTHSSPRAFERDRRKDGELTDAGLTVVRATAGQVRDAPEPVVARIRRTLDRLST